MKLFKAIANLFKPAAYGYLVVYTGRQSSDIDITESQFDSYEYYNERKTAEARYQDLLNDEDTYSIHLVKVLESSDYFFKR